MNDKMKVLQSDIISGRVSVNLNGYWMNGYGDFGRFDIYGQHGEQVQISIDELEVQTKDRAALLDKIAFLQDELIQANNRVLVTQSDLGKMRDQNKRLFDENQTLKRRAGWFRRRAHE